MNENTKQLRNRYHGALLGLAAGDALGTTLEFRSPGPFRPLIDMVGGGPFALQPGQWTDDISYSFAARTQETAQIMPINTDTSPLFGFSFFGG